MARKPRIHVPGGVYHVSDPKGHITAYRFNGQGYLIEETRTNEAVIQYERAIGTNQLLSTTDPLGRKTTFTYDANNNIETVTDPDGTLTQFTYETSFNQVSTIRAAVGAPEEQLTQFFYDPQGNLVTVKDPSLQDTTITYNGAGQPLTVTDPLLNVTLFDYDADGNLNTTTDPLLNTTTRIYDKVSRLLTVTDPRGLITGYVYDKLNRVTTIVHPEIDTSTLENEKTQFTYDENGNLLKVTDAKENTTTYTYDNQDRLVTRKDPLQKIESYDYDLNGNLTQFTDRKNQITTFRYDEQNRRIETNFHDTSRTFFFYDTVGRLTKVDDSDGGVIEFAYDNLDRLVSELTSQGIITYGYDKLNRRDTMIVNGGTPVDYQYDPNSRLTQVAQGAQFVDLQYDVAGRRNLLTYPNGTSTDYIYDDTNRLKDIIHKVGTTPFETLTYTYDSAGNRKSANRINSAGSSAVLPPDPLSADYNVANQQIQFNSPTPNLTYDDNGNLISQTDASGMTTYTWDARNRLVGISGPTTTASFVYDGLGRRISKTINGVQTDFHYDGKNIIAEIRGGAVGASYLRSLSIDEAFLRQSSGDEYYHVDALGSTLGLTDATGAVATTYEYEAFGETVINGTSTNSFQYTGRENDGTGLYYYRARYYSPTLDRFLIEDPLKLPAKNLNRFRNLIRNLNLYVYGFNNSLRFIDPLGLELVEVCNPKCSLIDTGNGSIEIQDNELLVNNGPIEGGTGITSDDPEFFQTLGDSAIFLVKCFVNVVQCIPDLDIPLPPDLFPGNSDHSPASLSLNFGNDSPISSFGDDILGKRK